MEEESFIGAFGDVPTDLAGDYSQLYIFRAEDFGAWYRRVRDAHEREVTMAHGEAVTELGHKVVSEYVKLPVDADGVPIHVGDKLTDGEYTFTAYDLAAFGDGSWSIRNEDGNAWAACDVTHHHAPTVEDVLREFADEVWNRCCEGATASDSGIDELVAECAAKLRLADDKEE